MAAGQRAPVTVISGTGQFQRDFQGKQSALPRSVAMDIEAAIHFNRRQGAAVQAKPMAVLAGREAVIEDAGQVLREMPSPRSLTLRLSVVSSRMRIPRVISVGAH